MNLGEVKQYLYNLVAMYHPGATIVWTKTGGVKPKAPFISLTYSNLYRSQFPLADDEEDNYYNYSMTFEINLYTKGKAEPPIMKILPWRIWTNLSGFLIRPKSRI